MNFTSLKLRGRYKLLHQLGSGGFGTTYLAVDEDLPGSPQRVVKHLQPLHSSPTLLDFARHKFKQEAEVLYRLKHPQIPQLFAYFEEENEFYLVQDYIQGDDLSKTELFSGKRLKEVEAIALLRDILEVLAYVHQQRVIHRDLKPQNIIRRKQDGKIFLIDFGAVKEIPVLENNSQGQTITTVAIGTPGYMPSEQQARKPKFCSDVYAVGMMGIQALTGVAPAQLPVDGDTLEVIWHNLAPVSPQFAAILDRMVCYDFRQRYATAVEALQAIEAIAPEKKLPATTQHAATTVVSESQHILADDEIISSKSKLPFSRQKIALFTGGFIASAIALGFGIKTVFFNSSNIPLVQYKNSDYGMTIAYPESWDMQESSAKILPDVIAKFISPQESESDPFQEQISVTVEDLASALSLDEYTKSAKEQIVRLNPGAKIISEKKMTLGSRAAYNIVYSVKEAQKSLQKMETWTLKDFKVYSVTYEAEADKYSEYENVAKKMLRSVKFETNKKL